MTEGVISCYTVPNSQAIVEYYDHIEGRTVACQTVQAAIVWDLSSFHPRSQFRIDHFWLTLPRRIGPGKLFSFVRMRLPA